MSSSPNAPLHRQAKAVPNRINTLEFAFDIAATPGSRVSALQSPDRLLLAIRQELLATIDAVIDDAAAQSGDITVTELDIDLGAFDDPPDWPRVRDTLRQTLQSALSPYLRRGAHVADPPPAMSQVPPTALAITAASDRAALRRVLTGASNPGVNVLNRRMDQLSGEALTALLAKLDSWQVHDGTTANAASTLIAVRQAEHSLSEPSAFLRDRILKALCQDIRPSSDTTQQQSRTRVTARPSQQSAIAMLGLETGLNPAKDAATRLFADLTPNDAASDTIALDPAALRLWVDGQPRRAETIVATLCDAKVSQLVNALIPDGATALRTALANLAQCPDPALAARSAAIALLSRAPVDLAKLRATQTARSAPPEAALAALLAATGEHPLQAAALAVSLGQSEAPTDRPDFRADQTAAAQTVRAKGPASAPSRPVGPTRATGPSDVQMQTSDVQSSKTRGQNLHDPDERQRHSGSTGSVHDDTRVSASVTGKMDQAADTARFATRRAAMDHVGGAVLNRDPLAGVAPGDLTGAPDLAAKGLPEKTAADAEGANSSQDPDIAGAPADRAKSSAQQPAGTGDQPDDPDTAPTFSSRRDRARDSLAGNDNDRPGASRADQIAVGKKHVTSAGDRVGGVAAPTQPKPEAHATTMRNGGVDVHANDPAPAGSRFDAGKPVIKGHDHDPATAAIPSHPTKPADETPEPERPDVRPENRSAPQRDMNAADRNTANVMGPDGNDASGAVGHMTPLDRSTAGLDGTRDTSASDHPTQEDAQTAPTKSGQPTDPVEKSSGTDQPRTTRLALQDADQLRGNHGPRFPESVPTADQPPQEDAPMSRTVSLTPRKAGVAPLATGAKATGHVQARSEKPDPQDAVPAPNDTSMGPAADGADAAVPDPLGGTGPDPDHSANQSRHTQPAAGQERFAAEQRMRALFEKLTGAQSSSQLARLELVQSVLGSDRARHDPSRAGFWVAALAAAAHADQNDASLLAAFVRAVVTTPQDRTARLRGAIARLGYAAAGVDATLRQNVRTELQRMLDADQPPARHIPKSRPTPSQTAANGNRVMTRQSGLVLFHPYLSMLFTRLDVAHDKKGIARDHLDRAAAALLWLAMGRQEQVQVADPLVLCLLGLPPDAPAAAPVPLTKDDMALIDGLIAAVIAQWGRLGKTSPDGLRAAFIQREGVFQHDAATPQLTVNTGPYDMLLDGLPWSINMIALPWMPAPLSVKWRPGND